MRARLGAANRVVFLETGTDAFEEVHGHDFSRGLVRRLSPRPHQALKARPKPRDRSQSEYNGCRNQ